MSNINKNHGTPLSPDWAHVVPEDVYHKKALAGQAISSTMLREFMKSPAQYFARITGRIFEKNIGALRIGRAFHKLLLEGECAFGAAFAVGGPPNQRTGRTFGANTKAFHDWIHDAGLDPERVLTPSETRGIRSMLSAVRRHGAASALLGDGCAERVAEAELCGLPCQARLDWLTPDGVVVDVKTTRRMGDFEADARRYGYLRQFAFYVDVAEAACGARLPLSAVVVEKREPYRVGVWSFPAEVLAAYSTENRDALVRLRKCRETNIWPDGFEKRRVFPSPVIPSGIPPAWRN